MIDDPDAVTPRHVLCVLGSGLDFAAVEQVAVAAGGPGFLLDREYSAPEPDPRMTYAFEASAARVSFTDADWRAVAEHDSVAYVGYPPMMRPFASDVSHRMLAVTAALLRSGATAAKNESNGLTHGRDRWLALADRAAGASSPEERAATLIQAWVKRPISTGELLYSCGMHLLGAPDVEMVATPDTAAEVEDCATVLDAFAIYLLTDPRGAEIGDGEGFRLTADAPRWVLHHHPCDRFPDDDLFHNPYGYWRLTPA